MLTIECEKVHNHQLFFHAMHCNASGRWKLTKNEERKSKRRKKTGGLNHNDENDLIDCVFIEVSYKQRK